MLLLIQIGDPIVTPTLNTAEFCPYTAHGNVNVQYQPASNNMLDIFQLTRNFGSEFNIDEESGSFVIVQWLDRSDKAVGRFSLAVTCNFGELNKGGRRVTAARQCSSSYMSLVKFRNDHV